VKSYLQSGVLVFCLLAAAQVQPAKAQAQAPPAPASTSQPTPSTPAQPPATPGSAAPTPAPTSTSDQTPSTPSPLKKPAPYNDGVDTGDGFSVEARFFGYPQGHPILRGGQADDTNAIGDYVFPGWPQYGLGGVVSVPAGPGAELRVYGFQMKSSGSALLGVDHNFFTIDFPAGSAVESRYATQDLKIAYEYTTYPITQRLRFKTLYEIQYVHIVPDIWIPASFAAGSSSAVDTLPSARHIIYPSFGVELEHSVSKHLRLTAKSSGFAFPHRAVVWDADVNAAVRIGQAELVAGAMAYHFKTSPLNAYYVRETITSLYVGFRWYLFK